MADPSLIRHDAAEHRFSVVVDGHVAEIDYHMSGNTMVITHTGVPGAIGGRGIAGDLVRATLDWARAEGLKVVTACSYSQAWVDKHPEYADLRA